MELSKFKSIRSYTPEITPHAPKEKQCPRGQKVNGLTPTYCNIDTVGNGERRMKIEVIEITRDPSSPLDILVLIF